MPICNIYNKGQKVLEALNEKCLEIREGIEQVYAKSWGCCFSQFSYLGRKVSQQYLSGAARRKCVHTFQQQHGAWLTGATKGECHPSLSPSALLPHLTPWNMLSEKQHVVLLASSPWPCSLFLWFFFLLSPSPPSCQSPHKALTKYPCLFRLEFFRRIENYRRKACSCRVPAQISVSLLLSALLDGDIFLSKAHFVPLYMWSGWDGGVAV